MLDPSKESIIGFLDPQDHILKHMASNLLILWSDLLLDRNQIPFLLIVANGLASHLVGFFAFLKRCIVQFPTAIQSPGKLLLSGFVNVEAILERFHPCSMFLSFCSLFSCSLTNHST